MSGHIKVSDLILLMLCSNLVTSEVLHIIPSPNDPCPESPCLTLTQFAADSSKYLHANSILTLVFMSTHYALNSTLVFRGVDSVLVQLSNSTTSSSATIICNGKSGRLDFEYIQNVHISGLVFLGCGGNKVQSVSSFILEDSSFQGQKNHSGSALMFNKTTARIIRSEFNSNSGSYTAVRWPWNLLSTGGAIIVNNSNIIIIQSTFGGNFAQLGGSIYGNHSSNITVINCTFDGTSSTNLTRFGGGVYAQNGVSVTIEESYFYNYKVTDCGGAIYACLTEAPGSNSARVNIASSHFFNNLASNGGALFAGTSTLDNLYKICNVMVLESSRITSDEFSTVVKITTSSFYNNAGGAVFIESSSELNNFYDSTNCVIIMESNFHNNSNGTLQVYSLTLKLTSCTFTNSDDRAVHVSKSDSYISACTFANNKYGGAVYHESGSLVISASNFTDNRAENGAAVYIENLEHMQINTSHFNNNTCSIWYDGQGGALYVDGCTTLNIDASYFNNNYCLTSISQDLTAGGGAMYINAQSTTIIRSYFTNNKATSSGGVIYFRNENHVNISRSLFSGNTAQFGGAVISGYATISKCNFTNNSAIKGGAIYMYHDLNNIFSREQCHFNIFSSHFINNRGADNGGALYTDTPATIVNKANCFTNNSAQTGAVLYMLNGLPHSNFTDNIITCNTAKQGLMFLDQSAVTISGNTIIMNNIGSLFAFDSTVNFTGNITFEKNSPQASSYQEGGAITAFQSNINFLEVCSLINNTATNGGAILATQSKLYVFMYSPNDFEYSVSLRVINNSATDTGGGIYLYQSELNCYEQSKTELSGNIAKSNGGAIHAVSSNIVIFNKADQSGQYYTNVHIAENKAKSGGGIYMEENAKLYVLQYTPVDKFPLLSSCPLNFESNLAYHGGALYVADETNSGTCQSTSRDVYSVESECFLQSLMLYDDHNVISNDTNYAIDFTNNHANKSGSSDLYGGLLDRCTVNPFAEVYLRYNSLLKRNMTGLAYFNEIAVGDDGIDYTQIHISSDPVQLCFCKHGKPDCNYQYPSRELQKGERFTIELVAVDQVNHTVPNVSIRSGLNNSDSSLAEGQMKQKTSHSKECTPLHFNIIQSIQEKEQLSLYAEGPCKDAHYSTRHVNITFVPCKSSTPGFSPKNETTKCEWLCDPRLSPYITGADCNYTDKSIVRGGNFWVAYINATVTGFLIYRNCPYDYCQTGRVAINFITENGTDRQCAHGRYELLCGRCLPGFSLSLGSTQCIQCPTNWLAIMITIVAATIPIGVALVIIILSLDMTVANGTLNGIIFYANIVAADTSTLLPFSKPNFASMFISWLNLEIGFNICFFEGMDSYSKTLLQLAFPTYIIFLVLMVLIISAYSNRFAQLISKKNPLATLGTMILLSYTKFLRTVIASFSYAILHYPDSRNETVWLPDATVRYLEGKHIVLFILALIIFLMGTAYTVLLFTWQWLVKWVKSPRLCNFMEQYHVPFTPRQRYWTGLLLFVRILLYILISVVNVSNEPATNLLIIGVAVTLLLLLAHKSNPIYKQLPLEMLEMICHINIVILCLATLYLLKTDRKEHSSAVAYTSMSITIFLFLIILCYHVYTEILIKIWRKFKGQRQRDLQDRDAEEVHFLPADIRQRNPPKPTYSVIDGPVRRKTDRELSPATNYHQRFGERIPHDPAVHDSMKQRATRVREPINTGQINITQATPLLGEDEDDELLMEAVDRGRDNDTFQ